MYEYEYEVTHFADSIIWNSTEYFTCTHTVCLHTSTVIQFQYILLFLTHISNILSGLFLSLESPEPALTNNQLLLLERTTTVQTRQILVRPFVQ